MPNRWRFDLVTSNDLTKIGELSLARNKSLQVALNKAGAFSFEYPMEGPLASYINDVTTAVRIVKNGNVVWTGPVWTLSDSTPNTIQVGCVGWLQTLEKRVTKVAWGDPLVFENIDAGTIALNLLTRSNADHAGVNYLTPGTAQATQLRSREYTPYTEVLNEIYALSQIESGYDIDIDPDVRQLNIVTRLSNVQDNIWFAYGKNIQTFERASDTSRLCNRMIAYNSEGAAAQADDVNSQNTYGLFEEAVSLSDVIDVGVLAAYANVEVAVRANPLRVSSFTMRKWTDGDPSVFEDFDLGDIVKINVVTDRLNILRQAVRVFSFTVGFDENNNEQVGSIQTTDSAS